MRTRSSFYSNSHIFKVESKDWAKIESSNDIYADDWWDEDYCSEAENNRHWEELGKEVCKFDNTPLKLEINQAYGYSITLFLDLAEIDKALVFPDLQWLFRQVLRKIKTEAMHRGEIIKDCIYFTNKELQKMVDERWPHLFIRRFIGDEFVKVLGLVINLDLKEGIRLIAGDKDKPKKFFKEIKIRLPKDDIVMDLRLNLEINWEDLIEQWEDRELSWAKELENTLNPNSRVNMSIKLNLAKLKERNTPIAYTALEKILTAIKEQALSPFKKNLKTDVITVKKESEEDIDWYYRGIDELLKFLLKNEDVNEESLNNLSLNAKGRPYIENGILQLRGLRWGSSEKAHLIKEVRALGTTQEIRISTFIDWRDLIAQSEAEAESEAI